MKWTAGNRDNVEDVRAQIGRRADAHGRARASAACCRARPELGDRRRLPFAGRPGCDLHRSLGQHRYGGPAVSCGRHPRKNSSSDFVDAVMRDVQEIWQAKLGGRYQATRARHLSRRHPVGLRHRAVGDRSLLLPGRPARLSRPGFLRRAARALPRAGRFRAGLRARARGRSSRAAAARHRRAGAAAAAVEPDASRTRCRSGSSCRPTASPASGATRPRSPAAPRRGKWSSRAGDLEEGLNAAASIGDDRIQRMSGARVAPDRFTHGSSEQRVSWFRRGFRAATSRRATRSSSPQRTSNGTRYGLQHDAHDGTMRTMREHQTIHRVHRRIVPIVAVAVRP